jgi:hypothetical protein
LAISAFLVSLKPTGPTLSDKTEKVGLLLSTGRTAERLRERRIEGSCVAIAPGVGCIDGRLQIGLRERTATAGSTAHEVPPDGDPVQIRKESHQPGSDVV